MDPAWPRACGGQMVVPPGPLMRRNGYGEATAFRLLNERLLHWAGSDWDDPDAFLADRERAVFQRRCLLAIQSATFYNLRRDYLNFAPARGLSTWGWKDPRNSLTLPFWLQAFPEARILHVRRDPEKIADSLLRRAAQRMDEESEATFSGLSAFAARVGRAIGNPLMVARGIRRRISSGAESIATDRPPMDRERCHRLTEQYVSECSRYRSLGRCYEEVHFEDILLAPRTLATQIADFAGISATSDAILRAAAFVARDEPILPIALPARSGSLIVATQGRL